MIPANSVCVQPRASSSSAKNSPGGNTSAAILIVISPSLLVIIFDAYDPDDFLRRFAMQLYDQAPFDRDAHRPLMRSCALQLLETQPLEGVEVAFVRGRPDGLHSLSEALDGCPIESGGELAV